MVVSLNVLLIDPDVNQLCVQMNVMCVFQLVAKI